MLITTVKALNYRPLIHRGLCCNYYNCKGNKLSRFVTVDPRLLVEKHFADFFVNAVTIISTPGVIVIKLITLVIYECS
jgi:hypothetical protein